jgi:hypothetical protein
MMDIAGKMKQSSSAKLRLPPAFAPAARAKNGTPGAIAIKRIPIAI